MHEHVPVLLSEVVGLMNVRPGGLYIDATFGRGGHSRAILQCLDSQGRLIVIDRDPQAVEQARILAREDSRVTVAQQRFSKLEDVLGDEQSAIDGVLFDLGVSTPQLDESGRGFSFQHDGALDMRMDPSEPVSAADWLMSATKKEISDVLWHYGDERRSRQIAHRIVESRRVHALKSTFELAELVRSCMRGPRSRIDPATRTFQAVRIHINDELGEVERALLAASRLLAVGGRILVIAFHSIEDRLVKRFFRERDTSSRREDPTAGKPLYRVLTKKPRMADELERKRNPRARSARLRVLERYA
ncbi:MAG: 16S rRNA (cytosine(1402)-N(4))-methyltransferase RsmH [Proteobacteria bacterium]|nr:16S rRNA (cytosine(1402)-N(4))-methyltransferase RsmH [Pseudomonadota bacterium]MCZ6893344.1 16S rRNA (cytosine(1402)-N(4))-methyltransferase RsmH [Gammaproteobacteria bacterium]